MKNTLKKKENNTRMSPGFFLCYFLGETDRSLALTSTPSISKHPVSHPVNLSVVNMMNWSTTGLFQAQSFFS